VVKSVTFFKINPHKSFFKDVLWVMLVHCFAAVFSKKSLTNPQSHSLLSIKESDVFSRVAGDQNKAGKCQPGGVSKPNFAALK